jgi:hypothetical protein
MQVLASYPAAMDRLHEIAEELIRLYNHQLTIELSSADLLKYYRRKRRMRELRQELQKMAQDRVLPLAS